MTGHMVCKIKGMIKKVNVNADDWEFLFNGKITEPIASTEEKISLLLNMKTIKTLFKQDALDLKIKEIKLDESGAAMIILEGGAFESGNILLIDLKTAYELVTCIVPKKDADKFDAKKELEMITTVLKHKELYIGIPLKGEPVSADVFSKAKKTITLMFHD